MQDSKKKLPRLEQEVAVQYISYRFTENGRLEPHYVGGHMRDVDGQSPYASFSPKK